MHDNTYMSSVPEKYKRPFVAGLEGVHVRLYIFTVNTI